VANKDQTELPSRIAGMRLPGLKWSFALYS